MWVRLSLLCTILAAPGCQCHSAAPPGAGTQTGSTGSTGDTGPEASLVLEADRVWFGWRVNDEAGTTVEAVDFEGDGQEDLVISVPNVLKSEHNMPPGNPAGGVYRVDPALPGGIIEEVAVGGYVGNYDGLALGVFLGAAHSLTEAGSTDIIMFGYYSEDPWVPLGIMSNGLVGVETMSIEDNPLDWSLKIGEPDYPAGVFSCGDLNGDGYDELCTATNAPLDVGIGLDDEFTKAAVMWGPVGHGMTKPAADASLLRGTYREAGGFRFLGGGDFNGDGLPELLIAGDDANEGRGRVFLWSPRGPGEAPVQVMDLPYWEGESIGDQIGLSLATGDLDGDGRDDVVIGAHMADNTQGRVYVLMETEGGPVTSADLVLRGSEPFGIFGLALAVGDYNGDGVDDLAVSFPHSYYVSFDQPGQVAVFLGPLSSGERTSDDADLVFSGSTAPDFFGSALTTADTNGDGRDELVVSARLDSTMEEDAGAVYLYDLGPYLP